MAPGKALLLGVAQDQDGADEEHAHPIGKRKLLIYKAEIESLALLLALRGLKHINECERGWTRCSLPLKVRDPGASLTPAEVQLLGMASVPVYKIITVSAAAEFGISAQEINDLSEIVAVDLVTTMTMRFIDMAVNARSDFNGADADSLREWREGLYETRRNFLGLAARTSQRFDQTFALIQRMQMLEKTLRTQLSPQMSAALRFSRTLNQQVQ